MAKAVSVLTIGVGIFGIAVAIAAYTSQPARASEPGSGFLVEFNAAINTQVPTAPLELSIVESAAKPAEIYRAVDPAEPSEMTVVEDQVLRIRVTDASRLEMAKAAEREGAPIKFVTAAARAPAHAPMKYELPPGANPESLRSAELGSDAAFRFKF